jgi:hypothetical protein
VSMASGCDSYARRLALHAVTARGVHPHNPG